MVDFKGWSQRMIIKNEKIKVTFTEGIFRNMKNDVEIQNLYKIHFVAIV